MRTRSGGTGTPKTHTRSVLDAVTVATVILTMVFIIAISFKVQLGREVNEV